MLEPHTATFPCGSFSRKSGAAVAFQNLDPSINQHPWFTPRNTHIHTHSFLCLFSLPSSLHSPFPCILIFFCFLLLFFFCPSIPLYFAPHPSLPDRVYSPRATSARLSATDLLIGFSLSAVNTALVKGSSLRH